MPSEALQNRKRIFQDGNFRLSMRVMAYIFYFTIFFMPDYFGVNVGIALNTQRLMLIAIWIWILSAGRRRRQMLGIVLGNKTNPAIILYLFVGLYTGLARLDPGSLLNPLVDMFGVFFTTIYFLETEMTEEDIIREILALGFVLCLLGIVERFLGKSPFGYLETIPGMFGGRVVRDGTYRITGPSHHPLGYGLFLLVLMPLACYDYKHKKVDLLTRPIYLLLILLNMYLTGSRSTLGIMGVEMLMLMVLSNAEERRRYLVFGGSLIGIVLLLMVMFFQTPAVQKLLATVAASIDGALGTSFAADIFGFHSQSLSDSAQYRKLLLLIFNLDWLNPWIGRGSRYKMSLYLYGYLIQSIDNFYVNQYIKFAYPGLAATVIVIIANVQYVFRGLAISRDPFYRVLTVQFIAYFVNLWWVDALGTLDYLFVMFGMLYVHYSRNRARLKRKEEMRRARALTD